MNRTFRFLLDENVHLGVGEGLRRLGIEAVHVRDRGLLSCPDEQVLNAAIRERRILVTGDIRDFVRLAQFTSTQAIRFPGVLLVPSTFPARDPALLIQAIQDWIRRQGAIVEIPGGVSWLSREVPPAGSDAFIREPRPAWRRALRRLSADPNQDTGCGRADTIPAAGRG
jgi:hypothetical protein